MYTSRVRRRLAIGALLVLLLAIAPNVTSVGHWPAGDTIGAHDHSQEATGSHAEHCHGDTSQCDGPALVSVTWVIGESSPWAEPESPVLAIDEIEQSSGIQGAVAILKPPPRTSA